MIPLQNKDLFKNLVFALAALALPLRDSDEVKNAPLFWGIDLILYRQTRIRCNARESEWVVRGGYLLVNTSTAPLISVVPGAARAWRCGASNRSLDSVRGIKRV